MCSPFAQKRKRRDYRVARRAQFARPQPGFSLYEGRTRGKRIKYTYSDEEDGGSDTRNSGRPSGLSTPAEPAGPTYTASGRQVRSRHGGAYGESMLSGHQDETAPPSSEGNDGVVDDIEGTKPPPAGRSSRAARASTATRPRGGKHIEGYNSLDEMDDESEASSSGNEWDGGNDNDEPDDQADDEDEEDEENEDADLEMSEDVNSADEDEDGDGHERRSRSLLVSLRYQKHESSPQPKPQENGITPPLNMNSNAAPSKVEGNHEDAMEEVRANPPDQQPQPSNLPGGLGHPSSESPKPVLPSIETQSNLSIPKTHSMAKDTQSERPQGNL